MELYALMFELDKENESVIADKMAKVYIEQGKYDEAIDICTSILSRILSLIILNLHL